MDETKDKVKEQYGAHAQGYVTSQVHAKGASLQRLVDLIQPQPDWRVLDISTGGGHTALAFAPHVREVVASDLTPEMLTAAETFIRSQGVSNVRFELADAENLPFESGEFDLVTNRIALHHYPDAQKAIREMARVLKPGGVVGFVDNVVPPQKQTAGYINHFEKLRDPSHNWCYPLVRLEKYFADAGFTVTHTEELIKEMEFDPWADRMGASKELKAQLRERLGAAPVEVNGWLMPRQDGAQLFFSLHEIILIARKIKSAERVAR